MRRRCACGGFVSPYETQTLVGIPYVHRYRCGCTTKFDIVTGFGRVVLGALNVAIAAAVLLVPASKFASSDDRMWIIILVVGIQVPVVAFLLFRSVRNERRYPIEPG